MTIDSCSALPESIFEQATDPGFKARSISEYRQIKSWVGPLVDLDKASILDFGCGAGIASASFALRHPGSTVVGCDIVPTGLDSLKKSLQTQLAIDLPHNVSFVTNEKLVNAPKFDLIFAWSVFNFVREDAVSSTLHDLKAMLKPSGHLFIQVNPLYFSPRGSHLYNYFKSPWHHLILSLETLRDGVLSDEPSDKERREWKQFLDLNRLTAGDIIGRASAAGLASVRFQAVTTDLKPPPRLARLYDQEALVTTEFMALFK